ncbi:MAG TPA: STAS domain-containing protein [Actinomycetota bacterium]|jgi:anti-anti-sigma factor
MSDHLRVTTSEAGGRRIVECHGELDIATAPEVEAVVRSVLDEGAGRLRLDWSGLTFMDSTGIRLLLEIVVLCRDQKVDLTWDLGPSAQRALDAVGIHDDLLRDDTSPTGSDGPAGGSSSRGQTERP